MTEITENQEDNIPDLSHPIDEDEKTQPFISIPLLNGLTSEEVNFLILKDNLSIEDKQKLSQEFDRLKDLIMYLAGQVQEKNPELYNNINRFISK